MSDVNHFIESYPTGKWNLGNTLQPNNITNNVKTSDQASADRNEKVNKNQFVCDNIDTKNEGFYNYERFIECKNNNTNVSLLSGGIIFILFSILFIYTLFQITKKK